MQLKAYEVAMSNKRILLIDDDHDLADLLSTYLAANHFSVDCYFDGQSGLQRAISHEYDLILLDVMMPKLNGFEVLKALGSQFKTPVLMLTAKGDNNDRVLGLELGADDYLAKPFHHQELLARINAILRRIAITKEQQGSSEQELEQAIEVNGIALNHATRQVTCHQNLLELTSTEYHVLTLLMQQQGNIVSKEILSEQVLGRKLAMFDRSIDVHVSNIRRKILPFCQEEKIKTVRGAGYIFLSGESL